MDTTLCFFAKEKQNEPNELLNAALGYADQSWPVFPCEQGGKKPLTANGFKDATTDKNTIRAWWAKWPDANIGSPMGGDRIVIDMDGSEADQSMVELERKYGKLPETLQAKTGRGWHFYFNPGGAKIKPSAGVLGRHLDVRGEGSYVILPPSVHANGERYEWRDAPMATLPEAWLKLLSSPPRPEDRPEAKKIPEGQRNQHLTSLAGSMRRRDMGEAAIEAALLKENQERCHPPLPDEEVRTIARSVGRYEPAPPPGLQLVSLGDLLAEPEENVSWLLDGILPSGGLSLLAAKPKTGKSTLARCLALQVARGEPFLGRGTQRGAVIYLALEEKRAEVRSHFRDMGASGREEIFIHAAAAPVDALPAIAAEVNSRKPVLLIIDPLLRFTRVPDANDYARVTTALEPLLVLARETGTHVLLVHHLGKGERSEPTDGILGSTALFAAVDTALLMRRTDKYRTLQTRQRYGTDLPEAVLLFDAEHRSLELGAERSEADVRAVSEEILRFLESATEPKTEPEIADAVEGKTGVVRRALRGLVADERVSREGGGKRGDPYRYQFSFSCSHYCAGTREQETQKPPDPRINTESILVPAGKPEAFLVPRNGSGDFAPPKQGFGEW
jgi:hypothetical protein